jgi:heme oxygenase (mycobilin-producing)
MEIAWRFATAARSDQIAGTRRPLRWRGGASWRVGFWHDRGMSVVKINAITVPADGGDELARRFAARAGAVDDQEGFEGFELLKPTDDRSVWLVVTRWRDEESFQAWVSSSAFADGHRSAAERAGGEAPQRPVGVHSELWSYEIAGGSAGRG